MPTDHPFTVAACVACTPAVDSLMPGLRRVVRECPHAVLIVTQCLLGTFACTTTGSDRGVMLLLQPCTVDRVPSASVRWVGPVRDATDVDAVCEWIAAGHWDPAGLPSNLRADTNLARSSRLN